MWLENKFSKLPSENDFLLLGKQLFEIYYLTLFVKYNIRDEIMQEDVRLSGISWYFPITQVLSLGLPDLANKNTEYSVEL